MAPVRLFLAIALPCVLAENVNHTVLRGAVNNEESQALVRSEDVKAEASVTGATTIAGIAAWLAARSAANVTIPDNITAAWGIVETGQLSAPILNDIFTYMAPGPEFSSLVGRRNLGLGGLGLTVGVINDSPFPVRIVKHEVVWPGFEFSSISEGDVLQPGQAAKWESYAKWWGSEVRIAIQLSFEDQAHTQYIAYAAKLRENCLFGICDPCGSLRGQVFKGDWNIWNRLRHHISLCGVTSGTRSESPDNVAFFLADVHAH